MYDRRWRAGSRRDEAVHVRRQHATEKACSGAALVLVEINEAGRGIACDHFGAVESENSRAQKRRTRLIELVIGHVIGVGPHAEVRIVVEIIIRHHEVIKIICASGISGF